MLVRDAEQIRALLETEHHSAARTNAALLLVGSTQEMAVIHDGACGRRSCAHSEGNMSGIQAQKR